MINLNKLDVIHFIPALDKAGISSMIRSFYNEVDKDKVTFHFVHTGEFEEFHNELLQEGSRIFQIEPMSTVGTKKYIQSIRDILKEFNHNSIVHIHLNYLSGLIAYCAKKEGFKTRVVHIRGVLIEGKKRYLKPLFSALMKKYGTEFFAVSQESGEYYYGKNFPFVVINNGVSVERYQNIDIEKENLIRDYIGRDKKVILQIGRLSHEKNHRFSLDLIMELNKTSDQFRLVLAGDGPLRNELEEAVKDKGLERSVILLGVRDDIPELISASYCTILPSISEGMPNVVIQSQAGGKGCICSVNITRDVDMGLDLVKFIPLNNMEGWIEIIQKIDSFPELSDEQIRNAIKKKGFDLLTEATKLETFYLLKGNTQ